MIKKNTIIIYLVLASVGIFSVAQAQTLGGITIPQGGTGLTSIPANYVLIGSSSPLHLYAVSTSSLGIGGTNYFSNSGSVTSLTTGTQLSIPTNETIQSSNTGANLVIGNTQLAGTGNINDDGTGIITCADSCAFNTQLAVGDVIYVPGENTSATIVSIADASDMVVNHTTYASAEAFNYTIPLFNAIDSTGQSDFKIEDGTTVITLPADTADPPTYSGLTFLDTAGNVLETDHNYQVGGANNFRVVDYYGTGGNGSTLFSWSMIGRNNMLRRSYLNFVDNYPSTNNVTWDYEPDNGYALFEIVDGTLTVGTNIKDSGLLNCTNGVITSSLGQLNCNATAFSNYFSNSSATTTLSTGTNLAATLGVFGTFAATSTTGTSTIANALGIGTSTSQDALAVVGGIYSVNSTISTSTATTSTVDFALSANSRSFTIATTSVTITFTNANKVIGKCIAVNVIAPNSGVIGTTTFAGGSGSGAIDWNGGINPGSSIVSGSTDQFSFCSEASSTNFIASSLVGTF